MDPKLFDALLATLTLPPKTPEDLAFRAELTATPGAALRRLERAARATPHGRWQRDACAPLALSSDESRATGPHTDQLAFCIVYLPDALPEHDRVRAELRRALRASLASTEVHNVGRLALAISDDPAVQALYRASDVEIADVPLWWEKKNPNHETAVSIRRRLRDTHRHQVTVVGCASNCCDYEHFGSSSCTAQPILASRICFDAALKPVEGWFVESTEADGFCVSDQR